MATVDNATKVKLEHLLGMGGGYVLTYSNASFAAFVRDSIGVDPYERHDGSKAQVLRHLWFSLSDAEFAKLTIDMLEYRRLTEDLGQVELSDRTDTDRRLAEELIDQLWPLLDEPERVTGEEAEFLARVVDLDLSQVPVKLDLQAVIADRLQEVEVCFENGAHLAVVMLCGSTLEGLLYEVAKSHPADYNRAKAAPTHDGKVRPFSQWTLNDLLNCSRELGLLGEDVTKFGHAVREFRNYIHRNSRSLRTSGRGRSPLRSPGRCCARRSTTSARTRRRPTARSGLQDVVDMQVRIAAPDKSVVL